MLIGGTRAPDCTAIRLWQGIPSAERRHAVTMDPRFVIDVLARLSTLEGTVKCHDSNATKLIGALTATKNLDDRHNANIAMLQRRIEQLEANATAQAESHRSQVESIQQRIQTLEDHARRLESHAQRIENQAQHSAALVQAIAPLRRCPFHPPRRRQLHRRPRLPWWVVACPASQAWPVPHARAACHRPQPHVPARRRTTRQEARAQTPSRGRSERQGDLKGR